ncbi:hypothetical protein AB0L40_19895 [Patulibacter sp. NPDC049589]|uniref:hypothetical protein n=1 Tax=Patulibacter sp. NPDC049589 TaxID=3154731 RepID=UPI0034326E94
MSFSHVLLLNAAILGVVLFSDLGRKAFSRRRLVRPLLIAGIVGATMVAGVPSHGDGLLLIVLGVTAGVVLGALAGGLLRVEADGDAPVVTVGGPAYAAFWTTVAGLRVAFAYGSDHWFRSDLGTWMLHHQVTSDALTDALVLMALAMVVTRTISVLARVHAAGGAPALAATLAR